ncbi:MAG: MFS transporter, partial [Fibrobacterota bacterium]
MQSPQRTASRRGTIVLLGALAALGPFSIDTYLPAFPDIARDYGVSVARIDFSLATYFLGICIGQLAYGPLMDRFGRRTPLLWGLALYTF